MAYRNNPWNQPKQDTGWGLIFRLNLLMGKIEHDAEEGKLDRWNLHIDRIYANIHYKNPAEIIYDDKGKVVDVTFSKEDVQVFARFAEKIENIKKKMQDTNLIEEDEERAKVLHSLKVDLYNIIFKKDIWIRKKMFELKLYLRETESDPRKAIYSS